jgi:hypothetical protein
MDESDIPNPQKLLLAMHNEGAISGKSGKSLDELLKLTNIDRDELTGLLSSHSTSGYIQSIEENGSIRYFLTGRGIIRVSSLFT